MDCLCSHPLSPQIMHLCAHSNGTHTECAAHVLPGEMSLSDAWSASRGAAMSALLLSVCPIRLGDSSDEYAPGEAEDMVVASESVTTALEKHSALLDEWGPRFDAICLRVEPNDASKVGRDWSGTNPPYLTGEAALLCRTLTGGTGHLLLDLPSADREDDGCQLIAHRTFFGVRVDGSPTDEGEVVRSSPAATAAPSSAPRLPETTITEFCYFPDSLSDGVHLLCLHVAPIELDAAPSRPLLSRLNLLE
jgi:arylformamidase